MPNLIEIWAVPVWRLKHANVPAINFVQLKSKRCQHCNYRPLAEHTHTHTHTHTVEFAVQYLSLPICIPEHRSSISVRKLAILPGRQTNVHTFTNSMGHRLTVALLVEKFLALYRTYKSSLPCSQKPTTIPTLSHKNQAHSCSSYFSKIHASVILPPTPRLSKWFLSFIFPHPNPTCSSLAFLPHVQPISPSLIRSP